MNTLDFVISDIKKDLGGMLDNAGIYYRIFARQKSSFSIKNKLSKKKNEYVLKNKKMQDVIGVRIVFYFMDDVEIINDYLHKHSRFLDDSTSQKDLELAQKITNQIDNLADKIFMPTRLNLIFKLEDDHTKELRNELELDSEIDGSLIDNTFEIQLRSVLSEGWHEVEHDLRYKSKDEKWWGDCGDESRMLNGIYASLETSEKALNYIFSSIAYKNYKSREWSAMLRNHLRIHTKDIHLSQSLIEYLNSDKDFAKVLFKIPRRDLIETLLNFNEPYPLKMDNLLFLLNRMSDNNQKIISMENSVIKKLLDKHFEVL